MAEPRLTRLRVRSYRSIRDLTLEFGRVTVITGANGVGKSVALSAISLLAAAAAGDLSRRLAAQGGMESALWAGPRRKGPVRMSFEAEMDGFGYELSLGLPRPTDAALPLDPIVKSEAVTVSDRRKQTAVFLREGPCLSVRDDDGRLEPFRTDLWLFETALGSLATPDRAPEAFQLSAALAGIRFYDPFRVDAGSPLRAPAPKIATPTMAEDGSDWATTLYSRVALADGFRDMARTAAAGAVSAAFDGAEIHFFEDGPSLEGGLQTKAFQRPFRARELSDGTLRFLALTAALTALRPPSVLLLNEPEASLNARLIPALAELIAAAADETQIIVATHDRRLADHLDVEHAARRIELEKRDGETQLAETRAP